MYVEGKAAQIGFFSSSMLSIVFIYVTFRTYLHKDFAKFNSIGKGWPVENMGGFVKKTRSALFIVLKNLQLTISHRLSGHSMAQIEKCTATWVLAQFT